MKRFLIWHAKFSEKKRIAYGFTHYQAYWFSWIKGLIMGALLFYFLY